MSKLSGNEFSVQVGDLKQVILASLIGGLLGGGINFLLYFGGVFFFRAAYLLSGEAPVTAVSPIMVAFASVVPALVGGLILYGLDQYNPENSFRIFIGIALAVLVISIYPPFDSSSNNVEAAILIAMHFVAAFSTLWGLYQFGMVRQ